MEQIRLMAKRLEKLGWNLQNRANGDIKISRLFSINNKIEQFFVIVSQSEHIQLQPKLVPGSTYNPEIWIIEFSEVNFIKGLNREYYKHIEQLLELNS